VPSVATSNKNNNSVLQSFCNMNSDRLGLPGKGDGVMRRFRRYRLQWRNWLLRQERLLKQGSTLDHAKGKSS
jgi:hypothetical protein